MRYVAAYLLAVLGGETNPSAETLTTILSSVGIEADKERLENVIKALSGKDVNALIAEGLGKLATVGPAVGAAPAAGGAAPAAGKADEKKDEKKDDKKDDKKKKDDDDEEEADMGGGFGLFGEEEGY